MKVFLMLIALLTIFSVAITTGAEAIPPNDAAIDTSTSKKQEKSDTEQKKADATPKIKRVIIPATSPFSYITQEKWDEFLEYVASGGKWVFVNFYHDETTYQHRTAFIGDKIISTCKVSGALATKSGEIDALADKNPGKIHNHIGLFKVYYRNSNHYSRQYNCSMRYSLFYHSGHALHATSSNYYRLLGSPASHGCTRQTLKDAKELFTWAGKDEIRVLCCREKTFGQIVVED